MIRLTVMGGLGRMGQSILGILDSRFQLVDVVDRPGSKAIGQPVSSVISSFSGSQTIVGEPSGGCDVVVDFASGPGLGQLARTCSENGWALVSGRTGLEPSDEKSLDEAAKKIPVLHAGNMSLGANLLMVLAAQAAHVLKEADIEIFEAHHVHKKDAPSGTALMVAEAIRDARGLSNDFVYGRQGQVGEKPPEEIAIHALRSGQTIGEHSVWYGLSAERFEIAHKAFDRSIFAQGALRASEWIAGQSPGRWTMKDVLGL